MVYQMDVTLQSKQMQSCAYTHHDTKYNMSDSTQRVELQTVKEVKDLDVTIADDLRPLQSPQFCIRF